MPGEVLRYWRPLHGCGVTLLEGSGLSVAPWHFHREFEIVLVDAGHATLTTDGSRYRVGPGSIALLNPMQVHQVDAEPGDGPTQFRAIYVPRHAFQETRADDPPPADPPPPGRYQPCLSVVTVDDVPLRARLDELYAALAGPHTRLEADVWVTQLMLDLIARFGRGLEEPPPFADASAGVRRAWALLQARPTLGITLDDLAAEARMSKFHLLRAFRGTYGMPPHAYQVQLRVLLAKDLLADGVPISEAAFRAGFTDQSHLHRHFRRLMRVTPGAFARGRNIIRDSPSPPTS